MRISQIILIYKLLIYVIKLYSCKTQKIKSKYISFYLTQFENINNNFEFKYGNLIKELLFCGRIILYLN